MRNQFDKQLFELNKELIEMGAMCEKLINSAIESVVTGNVKTAEKTIKDGNIIDQMERNIENLCMKLLLHQQPVARDLRLISAALKMITDMERIGDQAEDIAEIARSLKGKKIPSTNMVKEMAAETVKMVSTSIDAFIKKDIELAKKVIISDDKVDNYFYKIKCDIIALISEAYENGELALDMLMVCKYFERIGDHATNIAEWVIYAVTGRHKEV